MNTKKNNKGYLVLMLTITVVTLMFSSMMVFFSSAMEEYKSASHEAGHTKARYLAQGGMDVVRMVLQQIDLNILYDYGIMEGLPPVNFGGGMISFRIEEESGKLNINRLVNFYSDEEDQSVRDLFNRLSERLGISYEIWDAVVDWIDENDDSMPRGFEKNDYERMNPPRRIKNGRIHSVEELLLIPGFTQSIIYEDLRTEEEKELYSDDFLTEEEQVTITDEDFILANNITVYLPVEPDKVGKAGKKANEININSAPYHVLLSLSEFMTPEAAKAIIMKRDEVGRFKDINEIKNISELNVPSIGGKSLVQELLDLGLVTTEETVYKIVVEASLDSQTAHVMGIYDASAKKFALYLE
ncbi:MAG: general secretion pathway protein GspK [Spirochaetia bacterium]|nr:general secretion pathway protein GspK [Spirochaetia bacterium]